MFYTSKHASLKLKSYETMIAKYRLTLLLLLCMLSISSITLAQSTKEAKVTIEMTYEDANGKKQSETIEYIGEKAENFDADEYEKSLGKRDIKILSLDINQSVTTESKGELHEEHDVKIKHKGEKGKKRVMVRKMIRTDSDDKTKIKESMDTKTYEVEEKDGKIYLNGKEIDEDSKQIRIVKSMNADDEMKVEIKDGKVFINGEEVDDSEMNKSSEHRVIIKEMDGDGEKNIWISGDGESHDLHKEGHKMIFISDDEVKKPRLGIMIEDGKVVNGAEIVDLVPDSPAAKAGLQKGDTVTSINDQPVYGVTSMMDKVEDFESGDEVSITYNRGGKTMTSKIKLEMMNTKIQKEVIIKKEKH